MKDRLKQRNDGKRDGHLFGVKKSNYGNSLSYELKIFKKLPSPSTAKGLLYPTSAADLIWKPIKEKVRFVLVKDGNERFILMCSHLGWTPQDIILAYSYRFKIEVSFKGLKHLLGSFCYHFWTSAMPKLSKKEAVDLNNVGEAQQHLIARTVDAIEAFVNFGCIAFGILQILAMNYPQTIWSKYTGWLRTKRSQIPSEETVRSVIQETFYHNFHDFSDTAIYQIITAKQRQHLRLYEKDAV